MRSTISFAPTRACVRRVILWGCHVFCKSAGDGYETPWHQDGHYWPIRPLANCTVWVALEESTAENGCLRVIPRSHRDQVLHEHLHEDCPELTLNQRMADTSFGGKWGQSCNTRGRGRGDSRYGVREYYSSDPIFPRSWMTR
jgi:phytanoyl-CoA dioxygenase PhyH